MDPDKRRKIEAVLNDPASTQNEKDICRKLLKKHLRKNKGHQRQDASRYAIPKTSERRKYQPPQRSFDQEAAKKKARIQHYVDLIMETLVYKK